MPVRDLNSWPVRYRCSALPVLHRSCSNPVQAWIFSGLIFTTALAVFMTAKITFIYTSLSAVHMNDFHILTVNLKALLFVMWMVEGRVDLKITIIPVNNDKKNSNNSNNKNNINIRPNKYNDDTNHRQELFVLASHSFFISRLGLLPCLRLRSPTNV